MAQMDKHAAAAYKAVRQSFKSADVTDDDQVMVCLSGGADSLALAVAVAFVRKRAGNAGAVIVNHNLQEGSVQVAEKAAEQARKLGLSPVVVKHVTVEADAGGPENAARVARYAAFQEVATEFGVKFFLTAHTKSDNAEQVLLGLARGSGSRSLAGIPPVRADGPYTLLRPFVNSLSRRDTELVCTASGVLPWADPQNEDTCYTRVRVRKTVLPTMEKHLEGNVEDSLNRTSMIAREDAEGYDWMVERLLTNGDVSVVVEDDGATMFVSDLVTLPQAVMGRMFRHVAENLFNSYLSREHTLAVSNLVTDWHGQKPVNVPGFTVQRTKEGTLLLRA